MKIIMDPRRFVRHLFVLPALLALIGCFGGKKPNVEPTPDPAWTLSVEVVSGTPPALVPNAALSIQDGPNAGKGGRAETGKLALEGLKQSGFTICAEAEGFEKGCTGVTLTESKTAIIELRALEIVEPKPQPKPPVPFRGRLTIRGPTFVDAKGEVFRPVFASGLTLLVKSDAERAAFLDWAVATGFNGIRVFAGHLAWAGQNTTEARILLPSLLEEAQKRGLYVLVTAITDSREGDYDVEDHLRRVAVVTALYENSLLEAANEPYHHTQADIVQNFDTLCEFARRTLDEYPYPWAVGAAPYDGLVNGRYLGSCGKFSTVHLQRGRPDEQIARMVQFREIARVHNHPVMNSEPIGAAERDKPGSRLADPRFFGRMGKRNRDLGSGGGLYHFEDGLFGRLPGPVQQAAAEAFVTSSVGEPEPITDRFEEESCASVGRDPLAILECNRYRFGRMSHRALGEMLELTVRDLNRAGVEGGQFGVLIKPGGNNCNGISCDVLCIGNGSNQRQFDVLTGSDPDGVQVPAWHEITGPGMVIRPCEVR